MRFKLVYPVVKIETLTVNKLTEPLIYATVIID